MRSSGVDLLEVSCFNLVGFLEECGEFEEDRAVLGADVRLVFMSTPCSR
jgi:hypothetical protein